MEEKVFCKRCGRELKGNISKKRGYGPECLKKMNLKNKTILKGVK